VIPAAPGPLPVVIEYLPGSLIEGDSDVRTVSKAWVNLRFSAHTQLLLLDLSQVSLVWSAAHLSWSSASCLTAGRSSRANTCYAVRRVSRHTRPRRAL
jgi:hypothetical protein